MLVPSIKDLCNDTLTSIGANIEMYMRRPPRMAIQQIYQLWAIGNRLIRCSQATTVISSIPSCSEPAPKVVILLPCILLLIKPTRSCLPHVQLRAFNSLASDAVSHRTMHKVWSPCRMPWKMLVPVSFSGAGCKKRPRQRVVVGTEVELHIT